MRNTDFVEPPSFFANNASTSNVDAPAKPSSFNRTSSITPQLNRFGSQTQTLTREKAKEKNDTQIAIDDTL